MLTSRVLPAVRLLKNTVPNYIKQSIRNHGSYNYRVGAPEPSKTVQYAAEGISAVTWWWILWHLWTEPGHIIGEFEYPDPSKWTNEELGIK